MANGITTSMGLSDDATSCLVDAGADLTSADRVDIVKVTITGDAAGIERYVEDHYVECLS